MRAIPERLRDVSCIGAVQIDITFTLNALTLLVGKDIWSDKILLQQSKGSPSEAFGKSNLVWSNLWKNRPNRWKLNVVCADDSQY